jgi:serine/threonine protein kinase
MLQCNEEVSVNQNTYKIIKLLGHGKGGYSYLAQKDGENFVLKQIHHEPCDYYNFGNKIESECHDYKRLEQIGIRMPKMLDVDLKEERIIKEYIEGETIYDLVLKDKVQNDYIKQMKEMCAILYAANTNIDYFPTNFVVQNNLLYYIDYECNDYMDEWNFENWGIKYWSKTPEFLEYVSKNSGMKA